MLQQEDSNGENSFEIINKKNGDSNTETLSNISSPYSLPSPSGNLLANITPSAAVPDFTVWPSTPIQAPTPLPPNLLPPQPVSIQPQPFPATQFSAVIPPNKGVPINAIPTVNPEDNQTGGFIGWMKDAVSSGGILSKVAEKAKHSVDSIITTLDPQMSEFIYSGGDLEITVVTSDVEEIAAVREAIYAVLGKAWVNESDVKLSQDQVTIGFEQGFTKAEEKINKSLEKHKSPTIAIENIIINENNSWFDLNVLILKDQEKQIICKNISQSTPIPEDFLKHTENEQTDTFLSKYLKTKSDWQQTCGVSRREVLFLATKTLIKIYKDKLLNGK